MKTKCRGWKPLCDCDTELCGSFSTDRQLSQKSDRCNVAECHGPPVRKRSGQLEETLNMKPAWKGWRMPPLTSLHLIVYNSMCGTEEFQNEPGFHSLEADPSISIPMKSALQDWQLGCWADKSPTRKSGGTRSRDPCMQPWGNQDLQLI